MDYFFVEGGGVQKLCWPHSKIIRGACAPLFLRLCKHKVTLRKHVNVAGRVSSLKAQDSLRVQVRRQVSCERLFLLKLGFFHTSLHKDRYRILAEKIVDKDEDQMSHVRNTVSYPQPWRIFCVIGDKYF